MYQTGRIIVHRALAVFLFNPTLEWSCWEYGFSPLKEYIRRGSLLFCCRLLWLRSLPLPHPSAGKMGDLPPETQEEEDLERDKECQLQQGSCNHGSLSIFTLRFTLSCTAFLTVFFASSSPHFLLVSPEVHTWSLFFNNKVNIRRYLSNFRFYENIL